MGWPTAMQPDLHLPDTTTILAERTAQPGAADWWETARSLGYPAAIWRLPSQREKHLIVSFDSIVPRVSVDLEELPAGFAFSPFNNLDFGPDSPARTLFLRADLHAVFGGESGEAAHHTVWPDSDNAAQFRRALTNCPLNQSGSLLVGPPKPVHDPDAEAVYVANVGEAVAAMQRGEFRKVVLSRTKQVAFANAPDAVALFDTLCETYPTAFVSAVSLPERGQIWMSATPERLVSQDADGIFRTVSLAGTQSALDASSTPIRPSEAMWSQKEIEEQALVSRYIIDCFKKIRLREYLEEGPKTIVAGNLMHLGTQFTIDTRAVRYPQLGTVMLRLLHPTSAVCGMPRDLAFQFIQEHEAHDREFYAGFLGPVNIGSANAGAATNLFVHIRCMKMEGSIATLYAGAGLTEDSVPEREWYETEMKCQTLLKVIMTVRHSGE